MLQQMMAELSARPDRFANVDTNKNILIRCPNPEHKGGMQTGTGLRIQTQGRYAGNFKCYGCNFRGQWNDLKRFLKIKSLEKLTSDNHEVFSAEHLAALGLQTGGGSQQHYVEAEHETPWFADTDWRGIDGKIVTRVGGLLVIDERARSLMRLPVYYHEKRVGHVDCYLQKAKGGLGYINSSGKWSEYYLMFFDYCYKRIRKRKKRGEKTALFTCEGPRDALSIIQSGGLAVPVLGASNISDRKVEYLEGLGPDMYVHVFDGDDAGRKAVKLMNEKLWCAPHVTVDLPEKEDPASTPRDLMRGIVRYYNNAAFDKAA